MVRVGYSGLMLCDEANPFGDRPVTLPDFWIMGSNPDHASIATNKTCIN